MKECNKVVLVITIVWYICNSNTCEVIKDRYAMWLSFAPYYLLVLQFLKDCTSELNTVAIYRKDKLLYLTNCLIHFRDLLYQNLHQFCVVLTNSYLSLLHYSQLQHNTQIKVVSKDLQWSTIKIVFLEDRILYLLLLHLLGLHLPFAKYCVHPC